MSTENENWKENSYEEKNDAGRDGNRSFENRDGYNNRWNENRPSYNREGGSNYNREGGYGNRSYNNDRPQRSSYNRYSNNNDRSGGYNSDRPQRSYNRDGGYNSDRPQRSYNREGASNDRPYRPRFNANEGGAERRPRFVRDENNAEGGQPRQYSSERRPYNQDRGGYNQGRSSYGQNNGYNQDRPNWRNNNEGGDERPRFNRPQNNYGGGSSYGGGYNNRGGDDRQRRPRFQQGGDSRPQGFQRPVRRTADYNPNAKYSLKKQIEYKEQWIDPTAPIRLNKYLANAGVCSRREADEFIAAGVVFVNGEVVTELGTKVMRTDVVKFHEQPVSLERKVYILLNKPKDTVTTSDDPQDRRTVLDLVKGACQERIYPVGRLDRNTTGVLLLTNDGELASKLTHPKFLKKKIYQVVTDKNVTKADLETLAAGVTLDGEEIQVDAISYTDEVKRNAVGLEIHSGQNRVVRRIFETVGYKVIKLDRVYFAGLTKKGLKRGDWRYLTEREVNQLHMGAFN